MKAAILKNGKVIGEIRGLTKKYRSIEICSGFTVINKVEETAKNYYTGELFGQLKDVGTDAKTSSVNESPIGIKTFKLSYSAKNLAQALRSAGSAVKIKCVDYPEGFYQLFYIN
jgi:hypothetical protein